MSEEKIVAKAIFHSARTTIDGGLRISFDINADETKFLTELIKNKHKELMMVVLTKREDWDDDDE